MSITTVTTVKGAKKAGSGSPLQQQKTIAELMAKETAKEQTSREMQTIIAMFAELKAELKESQQRTEEKIDKMQQKLEEAVQRIDQQVQQLSDQLKESNQAILHNTNQIESIGNNLAENKQEIERQREEIKRSQEEMSYLIDSTLSLEMDRAAYTLRLRNIPEGKDQQLLEVISEPLAEMMGIEDKEMKREIDQAYRMNSSFARLNKVPRDVYVTFVRRETREKILKVSNERHLEILGKEIIILKQIPRKIRELRKQYHFITKKLNVRKINFKWLIPEGILVNWQTKKHRLDSVEKAREFEGKYLAMTAEDTGVQYGRALKNRDKPVGDNEQQDDPKSDILQQESAELDSTTGAKRKTRAVNPTYKQ